MKFKILFILTASSLMFFTCRKKNVCVCESYQECINDQCELKENHFRWGDSGTISGSDLYYGVVEGNTCIDTVVFNIEPEKRFSLVTVAHPSIRDAGISINLENSDTEFVLGVGNVLCLDQNWSADIVCNLFVPDSVHLKFLFWELNGSGEYVDSTQITLLK